MDNFLRGIVFHLWTSDPFTKRIGPVLTPIFNCPLSIINF
jgi:hypothetical protein